VPSDGIALFSEYIAESGIFSSPDAPKGARRAEFRLERDAYYSDIQGSGCAPCRRNRRGGMAVEGVHLIFVQRDIRGEQPGLSYSFVWMMIFSRLLTYARGTESLTDVYSLLDTTPLRASGGFEDSPPGWPQKKTYGYNPGVTMH
jgi:hypothetical protein